ncbi:MAG: alpha-mannosidase [Clostridia bacterium]|nr:alpha-mannosidase [Clostridia bacterium]
MKKKLHIIPHSHWDREWYQSFEAHRMKLVELFDAIIEEMEKSDEYTYYHMDGQFIPVEDYLEIRPHMKERLQKLIAEDRIQVGPWYVLQDEFLTSGEANVRNMLYGIKLSKEFGADPLMCGYFPDAFGNIGQAPQICQGFGIDNAVFGRGLNDIGTDNQVIRKNGITKAEMLWRAPDGSEVIGVLFTDWYCNAMELPADPEALKEKILKIGHSLERFSDSDHLLGMNGCDHQPLQRNLVEVIKTANQVQDEYEVVQSNFKDYLAEIRKSKDKLLPFEGEIIGQYTNGWWLLTSTASTHIDIKTRNWKNQHTLERLAEPASRLAALMGGNYDRDFFLYAWRRLMQNHPHDSICTCSCDEVYDAMLARFDSSQQVGDELTKNALEYLASVINTNCGGDKSIVVLSLEPGKSTVTAKAHVDFARDEKAQAIAIYDSEGNLVPAKINRIDNQFTYTLPKDRFRQPRYVDRFEVEFPVTTEGMGWQVYKVVKVETAPVMDCPITIRANGMANETLSVTFRPDGAFNLTDLRTGRTFYNQNRLEDQGDKGESYNFNAAGEPVLCDSAETTLFETTPYSATFKTVAKLVGDATVTSYVTLTKGVNRVDVKSVIVNNGENHRIRALFDTDISTNVALSEGQFDLTARPIEPTFTWTNPSNLQKTQAFVAMEPKAGASLAIANRGICEYEILRNDHNTVAITLLRCVAEMGDWGIFPTPKAQCKGEYTLEYAVVPYCTDCRGNAYRTAYDFAAPATLAIGTECHEGSVPASKQYVKFDNPFVHVTACKQAEDRDTTILRFFNLTGETQVLNATLCGCVKEAYRTNLNEEREEVLTIENGVLTMSIPAKKIVTIELV